MFKIFLFFLLLGIPSFATAADGQTVGPEVAPLHELVAEALANNPEIEAAEAEWTMFVEKARQSGSLDDPMLMLGINNALIRDPLAFDREEMTSKSIGISQMIPFFGKRSLARQAAEKDVLSARARRDERKLELATMVKETYAGLYLVDEELAVVERNLRVMDDIVRFGEARYGVGTGMQQEVLRAQVERSRMLDMRIGLQQQRRSLAATLNRLLARPADTPVGRIPKLETPPITLSAAELAELAATNRPLLAGLAAQVEKGAIGERLAQKEYYPDFTVALEYMQREEIGGEMGSPGYDMYNASVTFNLPVRRERRQAMVAEAKAQSRMARAEADNLRHAIRGGIEDLLAQLEKSAKVIDLYKTGIIPQAARSFESAQIAYRNNQADFEAMLESLQLLFNYERDYYEALADYRMSLARLEALVGKELAAKN